MAAVGSLKGVALIDDRLISSALPGSQENNVAFYNKPTTDNVGVAAKTELRKEEAVALSKALTLSLEYRQLVRIDNLRGLDSLVTLKLNNNSIEKMENLEGLRSLRTLDLSFNRIKYIQGLSQLQNLEDLVLHQNSIQSIEGVDALANLCFFSISNNDVQSLATIPSLRNLHKLRAFNARGNPMCRDPHYKVYIMAHLKRLRYLDYELVIEAEREEACIQFHDEIVEIEELDGLKEAVKRQEAERHAEKTIHERANVSVAKLLMENMSEEETMSLAVKQWLSRDRSLFEEHHDKYTDLAEAFCTKGVKLMEEQDLLHGHFVKKVEKINEHCRVQSVNKIRQYHRRHSAERDEVQGDSWKEIAREDTAEVHHIFQLENELMELEIRRQELCDKEMDAFMDTAERLLGEKLQGHTAFFRSIEAIDEALFGAVEAVGLRNSVEAETRSQPKGEERTVTVEDIQRSRDIRLGKLTSLEEEVRQREKDSYKSSIESIREEDKARSRHRILEIKKLISSLQR